MSTQERLLQSEVKRLTPLLTKGYVGIKAGATDDQRIEITAGLGDNDEIIVAPPADLKQGSSVSTKVQAAP